LDNVILTYDRSFEGFLSLVFHIYDKKLEPLKITTEDNGIELFSTSLSHPTDNNKAERVLSGLTQKSSNKIIRFIYSCFLSECDGIEMKLLHLIKFIFKDEGYKISDFSDPIIMDLHKVKKMIGREVHRMHAFVRFQETKDHMWACEINPDFNVLPLIGKHFKDRYPALEWLIYDTKRKYAIHHKDHTISYVTIDTANKSCLISPEVLTEEELKYQDMWKQYFKSVNIEERNNEKLHLRHVPKRYWPFLIEKR
jgi:probable DNA metabolism protein